MELSIPFIKDARGIRSRYPIIRYELAGRNIIIITTTTLDHLKPNESAVVSMVQGDRMQRLKFLDMGFTPHTNLTVRKIAPMGDPMEVSLRGYIISLRKNEASHIVVSQDEQ